MSTPSKPKPIKDPALPDLPKVPLPRKPPLPKLPKIPNLFGQRVTLMAMERQTREMALLYLVWE